MGDVQEADHFLIPLLDGQFALGQVFEVEPGAAFVGLTRYTWGRTEQVRFLSLSFFVAVALVDVQPLANGTWPIIGYEKLPDYAIIAGDRRAKKALLLDQPPTDPAVIEALMNAFHGLYPWDGFPEPDFFDRLLLSPKKRPDTIRFKKDFSA